jgi:hypothetical protein
MLTVRTLLPGDWAPERRCPGRAPGHPPRGDARGELVSSFDFPGDEDPLIVGTVHGRVPGGRYLLPRLLVLPRRSSPEGVR